MAKTTITLHLPSYRERALQLQTDAREAAEAYDGNIGAYVEFLKGEATPAGFVVATDTRDDGPAFSITEADHEQKKAAHEWLETQPDLWNWIP